VCQQQLQEMQQVLLHPKMTCFVNDPALIAQPVQLLCLVYSGMCIGCKRPFDGLTNTQETLDRLLPR
jgi:hypothetical protein